MTSDPLARLERPQHCVAVRTQRDFYDWEDDLFRLAREQHPRVAWWWAIRSGGPRKIAHCWVCGKRITHWAYNQPVPSWALASIEDHKMIHRSQTIPSTITAS